MKTTASLNGCSVHASLPVRTCACASLNRPARSVSLLGSPRSTDLRCTKINKIDRQLVQRSQRRKKHVPRALLEETITAITDTPLRDALAVGFSIVGAKVLVGIFEYLEEIGAMDKVRREKCVF